MKKLFFDVETTGVDYRENAIHQLSVIVDIDGKVVEEADFKIRPFKGAIIDNGALEIGGVTEDKILGYQESREAYSKFIKLLEKFIDRYDKRDKFFLVGYNNSFFDNKFLREFFIKNGDKYFGSWFWANPIDVYGLASYETMSIRSKFTNFRLNTCAEHYGIKIEEGKLHNAMYDVYLTREIFYKLRGSNGR